MVEFSPDEKVKADRGKGLKRIGFNPFPALVTSYAVTAKVIPSFTKTSQDVLYELTVHACSEAAEF